jgi:hypothetical protein
MHPHNRFPNARTLLALALLLGGVVTARAETSLFAPLSDRTELPSPAAVEGLPSPAEFLGYPLGARFTPHGRQLAYLEALDAVSDRVTTFEYGASPQGRPLRLIALSSRENLANLDDIRRNNLRLADPSGLLPANLDELRRTQPAIVWLAFGVHGNEAASPEAAMAVAYRLAAAAPESDAAQILESTVVLIDPLVNPDGHERYVAFYANAAGPAPNPDPRSAEHLEPWPGGRSNHFLIDLNRDWAWLTQKETLARIQAYRSWEPQVYVDFHEMGAEQTYFFPPPAEPVHPLLEGNTQAWYEAFGRANADAFDDLGWLYFIREEYDLLYPGYGDTYPSLRGAIGMTYEVGGSGRAGLAVELADGEVKTLADRVARHYTTALATLRTASTERRDLLRDFVDRRGARQPARTYLFKTGQPEAAAMVELLQAHGIEVRQLGQTQALRVQSLMPAGEVERSFPGGTYAVATRQPLGRLLRALMDAEASLAEDFVERQHLRLEDGLDAELYDITGWALPLAFNVETWIHEGDVGGLKALREIPVVATGEGGVGFLIRPQGMGTYRLALALLADGVRLRFVSEAFDGDETTRGAFFVPRFGNGMDFAAKVQAKAAELGVEIERQASSWQELGPSLGSGKVQALRLPRVALLGGAGVDPHSHGFAWQLLASTLGLKTLRLDLGRLGETALDELDVIVLPDGGYGKLDDGAYRKLDAFARGGGRLVAIGGGADLLRERGLSAIKAWQPPAEPVEDPIQPGLKRKEAALPIPGAVVATEWVGRHALAAGMPTPPPWIFSGKTILLQTGDPRIDLLMVRRQDPLLAGLIWPEAEKRISGALLVARERVGKGDLVLFAQEPNFRSYWRASMPFFCNAILGVD